MLFSPLLELVTAQSFGQGPALLAEISGGVFAQKAGSLNFYEGVEILVYDGWVD